MTTGWIDNKGVVVLCDYDALQHHEVRRAVLGGAPIRFGGCLGNGNGSVAGAISWAREIEDRVMGALPTARATLAALAAKYGLETFPCTAVVAGELAEGLYVATPHVIEVCRLEANGHGLQADDPERRDLFTITADDAERILADEARRRDREAADLAAMATAAQTSLDEDDDEGIEDDDDFPRPPIGPAAELAEIRRLMSAHSARPDKLEVLRRMEARLLASMDREK